MASSMDEQVLRAVKEIVVKFIETGRVSPTAFPELFKTVYQTVDETVRSAPPPDLSLATTVEKSPAGKKNKGSAKK